MTAPPADFRLGHLLVVAGASAVGKTTFMKRLAAGDLPPSVAAILPEQAAHWPQIEAWFIPKWLASQPSGASVDGVTVHYDLWRLRNPRLPRPDPALAAAAVADTVTVVTLTSSKGRVANQLLLRLLPPKSKEKAISRSLLRRMGKHPRVVALALAINVLALLPRGVSSKVERSRAMQGIWGQLGETAGRRHTVQAFAASIRPGWLSAIDREWRQILGDTLPSGSQSFWLEPDVSAASGPFEWRVSQSGAVTRGAGRTPADPSP